MNPLIRRAGLIVIGAILFALQERSIVNGQDSNVRLSECPESIVLRGRVVNADKTPIAGATVLLELPRAIYSPGTPGSALVKGDSVSSITDMEGSFEFNLKTSDQRLLRTWDLLLVVRAEGYATQADRLKIDRMLVDLPLEYVLHPASKQQFRVVDAEGNPVAGASLYPAEISRRKIPFYIAEQLAFSIYSDGTGELLDHSRSSLQAVYIHSDQTGYQRIPVSREEGGIVVRALPVGPVTGRIVLPESATPIPLEGKQMHVISAQTDQYVAGGFPAYAWQPITLNEDGSFSLDVLAFGVVQPAIIMGEEFPFGWDYASNQDTRRFSPENSPYHIDLSFKAAKKHEFRLTDEAGNPKENIILNTDSQQLKLSDKEGRAWNWLPADEWLGGQLFPRDALGRYLVTSNFGAHLESLKLEPDGRPEPIRMSRAHAIGGTVVDEDKNPIVGANVLYSFQNRDYIESNVTQSDVDGRFVLRRLPPNAQVQISAILNDRATDNQTPTFATAGQTSDVELVLHAQPSASIAGLVVDSRGRPIEGAKVTILRAKELQSEGYNPARVGGLPIDGGPEFVETDSSGRYHHPPVLGFSDRFIINVEADGYRPLKTPFVQGSRFLVGDHELNFHALALLDAPRKIPAVVQCVDAASSKPLKGVEVVFVGAFAERAYGVSNEVGQIVLQVSNTPQVAAAFVEGYEYHFEFIDEFIDEFSGSVTLELTAKADGRTQTQLPWFERPREAFRSQAESLFRELDIPLAKQSSWFRQYLYFSAQSRLDFAAYRKSIIDKDSPYEHRNDMLQLFVSNVFSQSPQEAIRLVKNSSETPNSKAWTLANFALQTNDLELKEELYGEALMEAGRATGDEKLVVFGAIATQLILDNRADQARAIISDAWQNAADYQQVLSKDERKYSITVSRFFAPPLCVVDPDLGLKLIHLTADKDEEERLTYEALVLLSLIDFEAFEAVCKKHNKILKNGAIDRVYSLMTMSNPTRVEWAVKMEKHLPDCADRLRLLLLAARDLSPGPERQACFAHAKSAWNNTQIDFWYHWSDPAKIALSELVKFKDLSAEELDPLIFACLKKAPPKFTSYNELSVFANAARMISLRDANLAKQLLESAFDDCVWLFDPNSWTIFDRNHLIHAAVFIDPEWGTQRVRTLAEKYSVDDPVRELQLYSAAIEELITLSAAR